MGAGSQPAVPFPHPPSFSSITVVGLVFHDLLAIVATTLIPGHLASAFQGTGDGTTDPIGCSRRRDGYFAIALFDGHVVQSTDHDVDATDLVHAPAGSVVILHGDVHLFHHIAEPTEREIETPLDQIPHVVRQLHILACQCESHGKPLS